MFLYLRQYKSISAVKNCLGEAGNYIYMSGKNDGAKEEDVRPRCKGRSSWKPTAMMSGARC
jgi:hypothetical protein